MADYQSYVTDLQKQFLTAIQKVGEVQAKLYEAVRDMPATLESGAAFARRDSGEVVRLRDPDARRPARHDPSAHQRRWWDSDQDPDCQASCITHRYGRATRPRIDPVPTR